MKFLCRSLSPAVPPRSGQSRRDGRHAPARHQSEATPSPRRHRASCEPRSAPDDSGSFLADSISASILIRVRREPVCSSPRDSWARFSGSYRGDDNGSGRCPDGIRRVDGGCEGFHGQRRTGRLTPISSFALLDSQTSPAAASKRSRPAGACHKRRSTVCRSSYSRGCGGHRTCRRADPAVSDGSFRRGDAPSRRSRCRFQCGVRHRHRVE
jgi:hypothetical protein